MYKLIAELEGKSPLSYGKPLVEPKKRGELAAAYEERCWRKRMHKTEKGQLFIPAMSFKLALESAASGVRIPGEGRATYSKVMRSGVMVFENVLLDATEDDIVCEQLFVPSDGKRGGSRRVLKYFPTLEKTWHGTVEIICIHPKLDPETLLRFLEDVGRFVGILRWRPENGGLYGRFVVKSHKVVKDVE